MKQVSVVVNALLILLMCGLCTEAQQTIATNANAAVPPLVSFSGVLTDLNGKPLSGVVGVTFSLYQEQQGGSPLWLETQNVRPTAAGHYTVLLGSTSSQGVPAQIFASGEARWLGVQAQGQAEQPRVRLVSAPYALKAADAETLGGKPASAFMAAGSSNTLGPNNNSVPGLSGKGKPGYVPLWKTANSLTNSNLFQSSSNVGLGTTSPAALFDVNGAVDIRNTLTLFPNGSAPTLSINGTALSVSNTGLVSFVSGQTFPGAGTVTSVGTGLGLKGGPITSSGTLTIDTTVVPQLNAANTFGANQTVNGTLTATSFSGNGANVTNVNASQLGGLGASAFAQLNAANTFTANQTVNGGLTATTTSSTGYGVVGNVTATTGNTAGVEGTTASPNGTGVLGLAAANGTAVMGESTNGIAVYGVDSAISGYASGVFGITESPTGFGVYGLEPSSASASSPGAAVVGQASSPTSYGVFGTNNSATSGGIAVAGVSTSSDGIGGLFFGGPSAVNGGTGLIAQGGNDNATSFAGNGGEFFGGDSTNAVGGSGVIGYSGKGPDTTDYIVPGVGGTSNGSGPGVSGADYFFSDTGSALNGQDYGVWGDTRTGSVGVLATADSAVALFAEDNTDTATIVSQNLDTTTLAEVFLGYAPNALTGYALIGGAGCSNQAWGIQLGLKGMSNCSNYTLLGDSNGKTYINASGSSGIALRINNVSAMAVNNDGSVSANGNLSVAGNLTVTGTKHFRIDHPLDPANKYLYHAAIESSEVLNLYSGNAILDGSGEAVVQLPDWFEAINKDFRYQLTAIGAPGRDLYIAEEVSGGHFKIAGGKPGGKVSWQVAGVRNDAWEKAHPMVAEADKGAERGRYLTPELYGAPETDRIGYEAPTPGTERTVPQRLMSVQRRGNASPLSVSRPLIHPVPPRLVLPKMPPLPKVAPPHNPAAHASKREVNQR